MTTLKTCTVCQQTMEPTWETWIYLRGKPFGGKCRVCKNAQVAKSNRKARTTEEGLLKSRASNIKSQRARRQTDAWYVLRRRLGAETSRILKQLANGRGTDAACLKLFGASRDRCLTYFERQLATRGWTWQDYLNGGIEPDHKLPFGLAQNSNELRTLALLENVELLTKAENAIKAIADRQLVKRHQV